MYHCMHTCIIYYVQLIKGLYSRCSQVQFFSSFFSYLILEDRTDYSMLKIQALSYFRSVCDNH